jgi:hypothetical protein
LNEINAFALLGQFLCAMRKGMVMAALALTGCSHGPRPNQSYAPLLARFRTELAPVRTSVQGYRVIDLASVTDFAWDSVYYFTGYQGSRDISAAVGEAWEGPEVPDHAKRLLFVRAGHVVTFVDFQAYTDPKEPSNLPVRLWDCIPSPRRVYGRHQARFAVCRHCTQDGLSYPLFPVACLDEPWVRQFIAEGCSDKTAQALSDSAASRLARIH